MARIQTRHQLTPKVRLLAVRESIEVVPGTIAEMIYGHLDAHHFQLEDLMHMDFVLP